MCQKKSVIFRTNKFRYKFIGITIREIFISNKRDDTLDRKLVKFENSEKLKYPTVLFPRRVAIFFRPVQPNIFRKGVIFCRSRWCNSIKSTTNIRLNALF